MVEGKIVELSVLFADLAGFTQLTNRLGADKTFGVVDRFLKVASEHLISHDGFIDKYLGDAVMAFFNVPIPHEDHALRAVSAAEEILAGMPALGEELGVTLQARIGIATGFARVGGLGHAERGDYTVIGDVVNLASRLEGYAHPGEILVASDVFAQIKERYPGVQGNELTIKGFSEPITVYRLGSGPAANRHPSENAPPAAKESLRLRLGSVLFTLLGMPCAIVTTVSPLAAILGVGAVFGAVAPIFDVLDKAVVRVPLHIFALLAAVANLYSLWFSRSRRKLLPNTRQERRKVALIVGLSIATFVAIGWETYIHTVVLQMPYLSP